MANQIHSRNEAVTPRRPASRTSSHRKSAIAGILLMAAAVMILLALVSYDMADEANADVRFGDLFRVFAGDAQVKAKADTTQNWLGLVGAIISDSLIKSTVGYAVICLPLLMLLWGWSIIRRDGHRRAVVITNYTLVSVVLVSASFGMIRLILPGARPGMEWSGAVGDFLSSLLSQLVGLAGGSILLLAGLLITLVLAIDLDVRQTALWLKSVALRLIDRVSRKWEEWKSSHPQQSDGSDADEGRSEVKISRPEREELPPAERIPAPRLQVREPVEADEWPEEEREEPAPGNEPPKTVRLEIGKAAVEEEPEGDAKIVLGPRDAVEEIDYVFPSVDLLQPSPPGKEDIDEEELKANADLLRDTLSEFDVELESVSVTPGPVVTLYELVPATGVKISRIVSLENDIAMKLAARGIRIMAPIPGKSAVGVEIPNAHPSIVTIRSVINASKFRDLNAQLPIAMGKTIFGEVYTDDLAKMPHLLIAGSTGSGKSVGINTIIASLLYKLHPSGLKLVIIDPKKIELAQYAGLRNHFLAVSPDVDEDTITTPRNAVLALKGVEYEMEHRYDRLAAAGVRNIVDYNDRVKSGKLKSTGTVMHTKMPYLVVVIDELADLMITAAREVEEPIARLAQLARAVGIHLIVATQRPSVDVITGVIKANFPARIAYQVASKTDSRTILDLNGAEQLLGNGDMLYLASGSPKPVRLQNPYITPDEVDALIGHVSKQKGYSRPFMLPSIIERKRNGEGDGGTGRDELFEEAARLIVRHQQGSVSLLQRRLKVGYSRAARLVDELEAAGIVGPFDGSKAREVLVETDAELETILHG